MKHKVAVYGTLRPGSFPVVVIPGRIYDLGSYPGLVLDGSVSPGVSVEIIEVDDRKLGQLDRYEGYDSNRPETSLYLREEVDFGNGPFFVYTYNDTMNSRPEVKSGDWLEYTKKARGTASELATGDY